MNIQHNQPLRDKLAAEYVLGTLQGGARRRFETWLRDDISLQHSVVEWQDCLQPMAEFSPPETPSPAVWQTIEKQLDLPGTPNATTDSFWPKLRNLSLEAWRTVKNPLHSQETPSTGNVCSFWSKRREDICFWRKLGMVSTAVAAIMIVAAIIKQLTPSSTIYVAALSDYKAQPVAIITGDAQHHQLTVKFISSPMIGSDRVLQLWAIPKEGTPHSLGLIVGNSTVTLPLPENTVPQSTPQLAISVETQGGSMSQDGPTGPILFKGLWVQI